MAAGTLPWPDLQQLCISLGCALTPVPTPAGSTSYRPVHLAYPLLQLAAHCPSYQLFSFDPQLRSDTFVNACRQHLRKCQCRRKTPPCKNCPVCRTYPDLLAITDPAQQAKHCSEQLQCAICACPYVPAALLIDHAVTLQLA